MAGPRFKLDLVSFDDPATLLRLPVSVKPSAVSLQPNTSDEEHLHMAQNPQLLEQLDAVLKTTDISYLHPINTDLGSNPNSSCHLARSLLIRNPLLFQYAVADLDLDPVEPPVTTPGPHPSHATGAMAVSTPKPQLETPSGTTPARKRAGAALGNDHEVSNAPASKKRARRGARHEAYIMVSDEAEAAAASLGAFLEKCIAAAPCNAADSDSGDVETPAAADWHGSAQKPQRARPIICQEVLEDMHGKLLTAQAQGYLHLVAHAQLQSLLFVLSCTAETGRNKLISEDSKELKSAAVKRVTTALKALLCMLVVYSTPKLPASLYLEELLCGAVELIMHHLQSNVLPLHDARFKRIYRPGEAKDDDEEPVKVAKPPRGRSGASSTAARAPRWGSLLVGQLEQALSLLAQVVSFVRTPAESLIPLVRLSQQTLTVASLQTLHYRALGLAVSMFKYYPQQRTTVIDQFIQGVLSHLSAGKHLARHFPLHASDKTANIQMASALVMQLVQVTAELPPIDAKDPSALNAARSPVRYADYFWSEIFKKLPKAAKVDTSSDIKVWVEALVEDILSALTLPEWPAAEMLLRRLVITIKINLHNSDAGVQLACIELVGLMARRLYLLDRQANVPEAVRTVTVLVDAALAAAGGEAAGASAGKREVVQELLLEHLAAEGALEVPGCGAAAVHSGGSDCAGPITSIAGSARNMIACNMLIAHEKAVQNEQPGRKLDEKKTERAVLHYRQIYERQRSCLGASTSGLPNLDRDSAIVLVRWSVSESVLGIGRKTLVKWLAEAGGGGRTRQDAVPAAARAKAIKLLGVTIEVDMGILSMADVQAGIKAALSDESVLVREAAVEIIGKHISRSADLAVQFYEVLATAADDAGLTVRKRAVRLLWECCVRCPDFKHRTDALLRIINHATDIEETMRALVTKICSEVWFLQHFQLDSDEGTSQVSRGADQRAFQLGEVVMALYSRMGGSASLPFHSTLPIVVTLRSIVGEEAKPEAATVRIGAREVADKLLERALELQGEQDVHTSSQANASGASGQRPPSDELFQCLLALHALCVADVRLLHRPEDPQRVIRCLTPYIKEVPTGLSDQISRRKAEQLLAVLAVLGGCMAALRHLDGVLADEIVQDLRHIISRVSTVQAVTLACQCMCTLSKLKPEHRNTVRTEAAGYYSFLENGLRAEATSLPEKQRLFPRLLYTLGTLCRHGPDILNESVEGSKHPTCASALDLVLRVYCRLGNNIRAKEMALQAMGFIFIAQPQLVVDVREVRPVLEAALDRSAPASIKARCLSLLTELLRSEEDVLVARQAAARQEDAAAQQASTLPDEESRALARRNGEGDSSSVSSGVIQMLWDKILALATDTTPAPVSMTGGQTPPSTPSGTASAHGTVVRRRALELIEVVIRGGIVVPWTTMPALCALATDPDRDNAARALSGLRAVVAVNTAFVAGQVPGGVAEAYSFHCRLAELEQPGQPPAPDKCRTLVEGLSGVWSSIFQPDRVLKTKFLMALLKPLDEGCTLASNQAARSDSHLLHFMTYIIAELPYRKMDELLGVLARVNEIVNRRGADVLARFQEMREACRTAGQDTAQPKGRNGCADSPASPLLAARSTSSASIASGSSNPTAVLAGIVKASVTLSLVLLLKQYLRQSYDLTAERIAKYDLLGPQRKVEEKLAAVHNGKLRFNASKLRVDLAARLGPRVGPHLLAAAAAGAAGASASRVAKAAAGLTAAGLGLGGGLSSALDREVGEVYKVLKRLMKQDDGEQRLDVHGAAADGEVSGGSPPAEPGADLRDVTMNLAEIMAAPDSATGPSRKPPLASKGRGRGRGAAPRAREPSGRGRGRPPSSGKVAGRASTGGKRGGKRKRGGSTSEESEDDGDDEIEDDGDGSECAQDRGYKPRATKRHPAKAV